MTSVAILGACGRMGTTLIRCIGNYKNLTLAAAVDAPEHPSVGTDSGTMSGITPNGILVTGDLEAAVKAADVVIDFTFHTIVPRVAQLVEKYGKAYVLGTTGLASDELDAVKSAAAKVPVLMAPNMSLGINLLLSLVKQASAILGDKYDAEIIEIHHRYKKDAPSGTALALADSVAQGRNTDLNSVICYGRNGITGERDPSIIALHSMRGGDVVGDHTVVFASEGERIEFTHKASGRDCLANGALHAAEWIVSQPPGFHTMKELLGV